MVWKALHGFKSVSAFDLIRCIFCALATSLKHLVSTRIQPEYPRIALATPPRYSCTVWHWQWSRSLWRVGYQGDQLGFGLLIGQRI